ncbi:unnamed protein product [Calicophoron daubneyi]|uniref:Uncharacterized protein n=1 Tax=Calicophoron daubneyi TaxID=300641 RepID=A0AAV2TJ49_CALDB
MYEWFSLLKGLLSCKSKMSVIRLSICNLFSVSLAIWLCSGLFNSCLAHSLTEFNFDGPVVKEASLSTGDQESRNNTFSSMHHGHPPLSQAIGFGFIATTVTNLAAAGGLLFSPLKRFRIYPMIVSFMVATAVGSLFTNALLVLLPEALGLAALSPSAGVGGEHWYVPISVAGCGGSFLFFILEFVLTRVRITLERRNLSSTGRQSNSSSAEVMTATSNDASAQQGLDLPSNGTTDWKTDRHLTSKKNATSFLSNGVRNTTNSADLEKALLPSDNPNRQHSVYGELAPKFTFGTRHLCTKLGSVEPVVWMVIIGDGVHNFMDGLSIGASFSHSVRLGISLSLAVLCEELPHELGDLAVLLRSGMSVPLAVLFNLASACTAYGGFFVGVFVGELSSAATYIFAITAGFFLYISLADMLAEMHRTEETLGGEDRQMFILFLVHCGGMLFGFACILTLTLTSGYISV